MALAEAVENLAGKFGIRLNEWDPYWLDRERKEKQFPPVKIFLKFIPQWFHAGFDCVLGRGVFLRPHGDKDPNFTDILNRVRRVRFGDEIIEPIAPPFVSRIRVFLGELGFTRHPLPIRYNSSYEDRDRDSLSSGPNPASPTF